MRNVVAFSERLVAAWYAPRLTPLTAALLPLSLMFSAVAAIRRWVYRAGIAHAASLPVPVIVVGSILAGGVGKTPLTRALAAALKNTGWRPGIVSRGYGGSNVRPRAVTPGDDPAEVGDEPLLLAHDALPVWIGRDRVEAAARLRPNKRRSRRDSRGPGSCESESYRRTASALPAARCIGPTRRIASRGSSSESCRPPPDRPTAACRGARSVDRRRAGPRSRRDRA